MKVLNIWEEGEYLNKEEFNENTSITESNITNKSVPWIAIQQDKTTRKGIEDNLTKTLQKAIKL